MLVHIYFQEREMRKNNQNDYMGGMYKNFGGLPEKMFTPPPPPKNTS